jgi:hypothetical protein
MNKNNLEKFDKHVSAIRDILERYKDQRVALSFTGCFFTMLEGYQRLKISANEFVTTCRLYMRVLDDISDVVGHLGEKISKKDFNSLLYHYSELHQLFSDNYSKTKKKVCGKESEVIHE